MWFFLSIIIGILSLSLIMMVIVVESSPSEIDDIDEDRNDRCFICDFRDRIKKLISRIRKTR